MVKTACFWNLSCVGNAPAGTTKNGAGLCGKQKHQSSLWRAFLVAMVCLTKPLKCPRSDGWSIAYRTLSQCVFNTTFTYPRSKYPKRPSSALGKKFWPTGESPTHVGYGTDPVLASFVGSQCVFNTPLMEPSEKCPKKLSIALSEKSWSSGESPTRVGYGTELVLSSLIRTQKLQNYNQNIASITSDMLLYSFAYYTHPNACKMRETGTEIPPAPPDPVKTDYRIFSKNQTKILTTYEYYESSSQRTYRTLKISQFQFLSCNSHDRKDNVYKNSSRGTGIWQPQAQFGLLAILYTYTVVFAIWAASIWARSIYARYLHLYILPAGTEQRQNNTPKDTGTGTTTVNKQSRATPSHSPPTLIHLRLT